MHRIVKKFIRVCTSTIEQIILVHADIKLLEFREIRHEDFAKANTGTFMPM